MLAFFDFGGDPMRKLYRILQHSKQPFTVTVTFYVPDTSKTQIYNQSIEDVIDEMVAWCQDRDCGRRVAYDMFTFRNRPELSMFLLRWA